jgi:hypothetical protein
MHCKYYALIDSNFKHFSIYYIVKLSNMDSVVLGTFVRFVNNLPSKKYLVYIYIQNICNNIIFLFINLFNYILIYNDM